MNSSDVCSLVEMQDDLGWADSIAGGAGGQLSANALTINASTKPTLLRGGVTTLE